MPPRVFPFSVGTGRNYLSRMRAAPSSSPSSSCAAAVAGRGPLASPPPPPTTTRWSALVGRTSPEMQIHCRSFAACACCGDNCISCQQLKRIGDLMEQRAETERKRSESEAVIAKTLQDFHADVKVWLSSGESVPKQTRAPEPAVGLFKTLAFDAVEACLKMYTITVDKKSERHNQIKFAQELLALLRAANTQEIGELVFKTAGTDLKSLLERMDLFKRVQELSGVSYEPMMKKMDRVIDRVMGIVEKVPNHPEIIYPLIFMLYASFVVPA